MSEEFCTGVKLLLARMKSNPEEFDSYGKWDNLTTEVYKRFYKVGDSNSCRRPIRALTDAEIAALHEALIDIDRSCFNSEVMQNILNPEPQQGTFNSTWTEFANDLALVGRTTRPE